LAQAILAQAILNQVDRVPYFRSSSIDGPMARFAAVFLLSLVAGGSCLTLDKDTLVLEAGTGTSTATAARLGAESRVLHAGTHLAGVLGRNFKMAAEPSANLLGHVISVMEHCCGFASEFRRHYIRALPALLGFPVTNGSLSELSVFQKSNGKGILRTRRCAGENCTQATNYDVADKDPQEVMLSTPVYNDQGGFPIIALEDAAFAMYDEMRNLQDNWGRNQLDRLFDSFYKNTMDKDAGDIASFWNGLNEKTSADFVSTETTLGNGTFVQVQKVCKNGECTTEREEKILSEIPLSLYMGEPHSNFPHLLRQLHPF